MADTPIEDFLLTKEAELKKKREEEIGQLNLWKQTKQPEHLQPLLRAYEPVISQKMRQYKAPSIPDSAFKAELTKHLIGAFDSFDPNRGAQLNTHVVNRLRQAMRYNARFQNVAYIPEGQIAQIAPIQKAQNELTEQFGRDPTVDEIADHMGRTPKFVNRVLTSQRRDIPASMFETDPAETGLARDEEVLSLLPHSLNPQENQVFSHLYGDKKHLHPGSMGGLAKQLGMSNSQLARVHTSILKKYKEYK